MMVSNPGSRKSPQRICTDFNHDPNTILNDRCVNFNRNKSSYLEQQHGKFKNQRTE
jgi:hypothetical protein